MLKDSLGRVSTCNPSTLEPEAGGWECTTGSGSTVSPQPVWVKPKRLLLWRRANQGRRKNGCDKWEGRGCELLTSDLPQRVDLTKGKESRMKRNRSVYIDARMRCSPCKEQHSRRGEGRRDVTVDTSQNAATVTASPTSEIKAGEGDMAQWLRA